MNRCSLIYSYSESKKHFFHTFSITIHCNTLQIIREMIQDIMGLKTNQCFLKLILLT